MNDVLEVMHGRANPQIDPTLSIWGWEIPVYLFLGGLAAGLMVVSAWIELREKGRPRSLAIRLAPLLAAGLLSLGMLSLFLDLAYKLHVWRFYAAFKPTSPMSWGSWILLLVYPVAVLQGFGGLDDEDRKKVLAWRPVAWIRPLFLWALARADAMRPWVLRLSLAVGAGLGIYTGILLGALAARPQWNSALLGPLFLTSGLSTGTALLLLFPIHGTERRVLTRVDVAAIALELALLAVLLLGFATGDAGGQQAFQHLTTGPWASAFWSLVVVAGLAVPLAMEGLEMRLHLPFVRLAPALVLVGGLSLRWVLLLSGQASGFRFLP